MELPRRINSNMEFGKEYIFSNQENIFKGIITKLVLFNNKLQLIVKITKKSKNCNLTNSIIRITLSIDKVLEMNGLDFDDGYKIYENLLSMHKNERLHIYNYKRCPKISNDLIDYDIESIVKLKTLLLDRYRKSFEIDKYHDKYYEFYRYRINGSTIERIPVEFLATYNGSFLNIMLIKPKRLKTYPSLQDALDALEVELNFK